MSDKASRECGGCTACCFTHSVAREDGPVTKVFEWCTHCTQGVGCSIYEARPHACSTYRCAWLRGTLDDDKRPDRWGIVVDIWPIPNESKLFVNLWEATSGRMYAPDIQATVKVLIVAGKYVVACRPIDRNEQLHFPADMAEVDQLRFVNAVIRHIREREREAAA
ncbi:MAG TPA: hypothetical protein VFY28_01325 [Candidatus Paceibacterota bacterium]|nr:hypothetical protein [Candidatus Paceibacterota bacterium]